MPTAKKVGIPFAGHVPIDVGVHRAIEAGYASIDQGDREQLRRGFCEAAQRIVRARLVEVCRFLAGPPLGFLLLSDVTCADFPESRNNYNGKVKASYFLSTAGTGSHTLALGYEDYQDMLKSDNYQSASSFTLWTYDTPTRADER